MAVFKAGLLNLIFNPPTGSQRYPILIVLKDFKIKNGGHRRSLRGHLFRLPSFKIGDRDK